jgi:nucleotide-binding universal stress UspA family protein
MESNMDHSSTHETSGIVVVGVDGSEGAEAALHWAVAEARLRKCRLLAVHAWTPGYVGVPAGGYGYLGGPLESPGPSVDDMHRWAEELLESKTAEISAEAKDVEIERRVVEGSAAQALVDAAGEHDLLVVGSRGHGGFAGLLLGSVSQQCAHHARCPVVVVHPPSQSTK